MLTKLQCPLFQKQRHQTRIYDLIQTGIRKDMY